MKLKLVNKPSVLSQLYRDFKDKINRKVFRKHSLPWMKTKELDLLLEVFVNVNPAHVLEWGSGFSTVLVPDLLPGLKSWVSLEHHKEWYELISAQITNPKVQVKLIEPDNAEFTKGNSGGDGKREDFKTYIDFPESLNQKFDLIFIDGRARRECLIKSIDLISDNGVIVVHDGNRDEYFTDIPTFNSVLHLQDYRRHRKAGGIWIGRKNGSISEVLDVKHHTKIWKNHDRVARMFFLR